MKNMDYREDAKMDTEREYNLEKEYNADGKTNTDRKYNTVEEALEDIKAGKIILVTDDPDREKRRRYDMCW